MAGLYENINKKRKRIKEGSGEKMRKKGEKGAPSDKDFKDAKKTARVYRRKNSRVKSTLKFKTKKSKRKRYA